MNDTLIIILIMTAFLAFIVGSTITIIRLIKQYTLYKSKYDALNEINKKMISEYQALQNKHQLNPSYETQLAIADLLSGNNLFRIERIDTEDLLLRRR